MKDIDENLIKIEFIKFLVSNHEKRNVFFFVRISVDPSEQVLIVIYFYASSVNQPP